MSILKDIQDKKFIKQLKSRGEVYESSKLSEEEDVMTR